MNRRAQESTPTPVKNYPGSGEAARFSRFLRDELIPFVEKTYRVDVTDRTLVGGSFGALFAVYDMLQSTLRALECVEFLAGDRDAINEVVVHLNGRTLNGKRVP